MIHNVVMPHLGLTMEEGSVVSWRKGVGERVEKGEVLFTVETDKTEMEVESDESGYLSSIRVKLGEKVPVGALIAVLEDNPGEAASTGSTAATPTASIDEVAGSDATAPPADDLTIPNRASAQASKDSASATVVASPRARRLAAELGIDIAAVKPERGPRVVEEDVRRFHASRNEPASRGPSR